jgi:hypothetical protein
MDPAARSAAGFTFAEGIDTPGVSAMARLSGKPTGVGSAVCVFLMAPLVCGITPAPAGGLREVPINER